MRERDDLDRELDGLFMDFALNPEEAFAYWAAALEHAYKRAKKSRTHELTHGGRGTEWSREGVHAFSAAMGRVQAMEMMLPGLRALWYVGSPVPTEFLSPAHLLEGAAHKDAEHDFLAKTKLGLLAELEEAA